MSEWYKQYDLWLHPGPDWDIKEYGERGVSKGDCIFNTLVRIIDQDDRSEWADKAIDRCVELLKLRLRWPMGLNSHNDARNRIDEYWSKLLHELNIRDYHKFRPQKSITRDPFVPLYYLAVLRNRINIIKELRIPIHLYTPTVFSWRRYLIKPNWWSALIYNLHPLGRKDYVVRLSVYMYNAYLNRKP